jgi:hypothetical protein
MTPVRSPAFRRKVFLSDAVNRKNAFRLKAGLRTSCPAYELFGEGSKE